MNIKKRVDNLLHNEEVVKIINLIGEDYSRQSISQKIKLFSEYNNVLNKELGNSFELKINKQILEEYTTYADFEFSYFKDSIIMNGIDKNPYLYLQKLLIMHLISIKNSGIPVIEVGEISYDNNAKNDDELFMYSDVYSPIIETSNKFFDILLSDIDNQYKDGYEMSFLRIISEEGKRELIQVNKYLDALYKKEIYDELKEIAKVSNNLYSKETLARNELALLSLNDVITDYFKRASVPYKESLNMHFKQFMQEFFPEYSDVVEVKANLLNGNVKIGQVNFEANQLFIDTLLIAIEKAEKNENRIDNIVSKEELDRNPGLSKLDIYFHNKLRLLDQELEGRNLGLINYFGFDNIYENENERNSSEDNLGAFEGLIENYQFIDTIERYLSSNGSKDLYVILKMMNEAYGADFKLIVNSNHDANSDAGCADDGMIFLNVRGMRKQDILVTLFHEYRHLMQNKEKEGSMLFDEGVFKYININKYVSPFRETFSYITAYKYANHESAYLQPIEYDAESFAKAMIGKIAKKVNGKSKYLLNFAIAEYNLYHDTKFIGLDKLSLTSYKWYLKKENIEQFIKNDESESKYLDELIAAATSEQEAQEIYKFHRFASLEIKKALPIYKLIGAGEVNIEYLEDKKRIIIAGREYNLNQMTHYELLECILLEKAKKHVYMGKMRKNDIASYVFEESRKYKPESYDEYNYYTAYYYHYCFDKYAKKIQENKLKQAMKIRK